jgi:hypothetical protein
MNPKMGSYFPQPILCWFDFTFFPDTLLLQLGGMDSLSQQDLQHLRLWEEEEKEADKRNMTRYPCPCTMCMGGRTRSRKSIRKNLSQYKRDPQFMRSILVSHAEPMVTSLL